jgi:hypothetical protein
VDAETKGGGVGGMADSGGEKLGGGVEEPTAVGAADSCAGMVAAELRARIVAALSWSCDPSA